MFIGVSVVSRRSSSARPVTRELPCTPFTQWVFPGVRAVVAPAART